MARDRRGATVVEYGLLAALIAVACVAALTATGNRSSASLNNAASAMPGEGQSVTVNHTP